MALQNCLSLLLVWAMAQYSDSYPSGAPVSACVSMVPGHGNESADANPYTIRPELGLTAYTAGVPLKFQVIGDGDFRGVLIQARIVINAVPSPTPIGRFDDPKSRTDNKLRLLGCSNPGDSVTHVSAPANTISPGVEIVWHPPTSNMGEIQIFATVAREKDVWWTFAESPILKYAERSPMIQKNLGCISSCGRCQAQGCVAPVN